MNTEWEYLTTREYVDQVGRLNELGAKGWELVSAFQPQNGDGVWFIFKRKVSKDE